MKKFLLTMLFLATGIPVWRWAFPPRAWRALIAPYLSEALRSALAQMSGQTYREYVWIFSIVWSCLFVIDFWYYQTIGTARLGKDRRTGYEHIDEGVPYSCFRWTRTGFETLIRNNDGQENGITLFIITAVVGGLGFLHYGIAPAPALMVALGSAISYLVGARTPTWICVTKHGIRIRDYTRNRLLDRRNFVTFKPDPTQEWLAYEYGARNFRFGGRMGHTDVVEISASLNRLLSTIPIAHRSQASYELRQDRSEF